MKKKKIDLKNTLNILRRGIKHLLFHNGWLKLIAIIISVLLWAGLISQSDTVTRDKSFQNVAVSITGSEIMKNNKYIVVSDLNELLNNVSVVAAVPQKQYENADVSSYNIRVDLSRIKGTGEQEIKLLSTNSSTYGRVTSINPASIRVQVEDYITRPRIPVSVKVKGDVPEGWHMEMNSVNPDLVAVSGPRPLVQNVSKATVFIDTNEIDWSEGAVTNSYKIQLFNQKGEEVENPNISVVSSSITIDSVLIDMNLMPSEEFSSEDLIQVIGAAADGYRIKSITTNPETITVSARREVLDQISNLCSLTVEGLTETTVFQQIKIQKPSEDAVLSSETVTVTVEIEPEES